MIIIFGHARSGTSSFQGVVGSCPGVRLAGEPFNPGFKTWSDDWPDLYRIYRKVGFRRAVELIGQEGKGFKHLFNQLPAADNLWLLNQPSNRVIFMWRRNLLHAAVSLELARITNVWAADDTDDKEKAHRGLPPLSAGTIADQIKELESGISLYKEFLSTRPHFPIVYEDFYGASDSVKRDATKRALSFVGLNPNSCNWSKVSELLSVENKVTTDYSVIQNYDEIAALGTKDTGFL